MKTGLFSRYNPLTIAVIAVLTLSLTACGGGSSGSSGNNADNGSTNNGGGSSDSSGDSTNGNSGNHDSTNNGGSTIADQKGCPVATQAYKTAMIKKINEIRSKSRVCHKTNKNYAAAPAIQWNDLLAKSTSRFAREMGTYGYYDYFGKDAHLQPDTSQPNADGSYDESKAIDINKRISYSGYKGSVGENLAYSPKGNAASFNAAIDEIFYGDQGWLNSKRGHCETIMNPDIKDFAMSCGYNKEKDSYYFVQMFGIPLK